MSTRPDIDHDHPEEDEVRFQLSRKKFIRHILLGSAAAITVPAWVSCVNEDGERQEVPFEQDYLSPLQWEVVRGVQDVLMPEDEYGPGALQIYADRYLIWILKEELIGARTHEYLLNGIDHCAQLAEKYFEKSFTELNGSEREKLVGQMSDKDWEKNWLSRMLTMIFEALFADPIYGSNPGGIGWEWMGYTPGIPRPTEDLKYPEILQTIREN